MSLARDLLAREPLSWADDPAELAALWRWLDRRCWPDDGCKAPDPAYFMDHGHKWADAYHQMLAEQAAA
jgi:hypothetical protein